MDGSKLTVGYAGDMIQAGGGCGCGGSGRVTYGGGRPTEVAAKTARALVGNRVLDLYLKYLGVTTLTSATLVPFALVLGRDAFEAVVQEMRRQRPSKGQHGGVKIPVVDDRLFGTYLKLAGLTVLEFTPTTLVPLGVLMAAYHYWAKKTGKQFGGASTAFNTTPQNILQSAMRTVLDGPQPPHSGISAAAEVGGYQSQVKLAQSGGGSAWMASQYSRGPVNAPGQNEQDFRTFTQDGEYKSNYELSAGAAADWAKDWKGWHFSGNEQSYPGGYKTLYEETPATGLPTGYNPAGTPTASFSGGSRQSKGRQFHMSGGKLIERLSQAIEKFHQSYKQNGGSAEAANEIALNALMGSELVQADYQPGYGVPALPFQSGGRKRSKHQRSKHQRSNQAKKSNQSRKHSRKQ
jgi:hypothetical protein